MLRSLCDFKPEEISSESGKRAFVNLKRVIWHEAVALIFKSIETYTRLGTSVECADGVSRILFPHVLMISADYEEQYVVYTIYDILKLTFLSRCNMALVRGQSASFPCPVCLVPKTEIMNLSVSFEARTSDAMEAIYRRAQTLNATARETLLQSVGLRDVNVTLFFFRNFN